MSDPYGNWEEEGEDFVDVDLDNIPDSSQDVAVELLAGDQREVLAEVQAEVLCEVPGQDRGEEVKVNVLAELNGEEVTDTEHDIFLEETFALSDENGVNEDNAFEIMDVGCDRPHKSEDLTDESMSFIANPKNEKSAKTHRRYQNQHVKHCKEDAIREIPSETALVAYFSTLACEGKHVPGTTWCTCICSRSCAMV